MINIKQLRIGDTIMVSFSNSIWIVKNYTEKHISFELIYTMYNRTEVGKTSVIEKSKMDVTAMSLVI